VGQAPSGPTVIRPLNIIDQKLIDLIETIGVQLAIRPTLSLRMAKEEEVERDGTSS